MKLSERQKELLATGTYASKQVLTKSSFWLRWSHSARFHKGIEYISKMKPTKIVDYGCGDGTLLIFLEGLVEEKIGLDIDPKQVRACNDRLGKISGYEFHHTSVIATIPPNSIPCIVCTEVLEHIPERDHLPLLATFKKVMSPNGFLLISVPIEIGFSLLFKQFIRNLAGLKKIGSYQYTKNYRFKELIRALFATATTNLERIETVSQFENFEHPSTEHKGFNWKKIQCILETEFIVKEISYTPLNFLSSFFNSQVWFLCQKKLSD